MFGFTTGSTIAYGDYAEWQRQVDVSADIDYWRAALDGIPPMLTLPTDRPRPKALSYEGAQALFSIDPETASALRQVARDQNTTLFATALAAFAAFLNRIGAGSDLPIGTPMSNRAQAATADMVGLFVNTLVLRLTADPSQSFADLVQGARTQILSAFAHADVPSHFRGAPIGLITAGFLLSLAYNVVGLSFAVQGILSPVVAAILMPISTVSLVLFAVAASWMRGKQLVGV